MSKKIFHAIWAVSLIILLVALVVLACAFVQYFTDVQMNQLKIEAELAAQGASLNGASYFDGLDTEDYRITWIDSDGNVLYDNEADSEEMENHLEREEVSEALSTGSGKSIRYSRTLGQKLLYYAVLLPDGTVMRLSSAQRSIWSLLLGFSPVILGVAALGLLLSFLLASRIASRIVEPINKIDPDVPDNYIGISGYAEIEPLLKRMSAQQKQLKQDQSELEKTSLIRQEFTANASHELKTPLHAISGYAELIENGMVHEKDIKPFAGKIRSESQRLTKLVEDIIDLNKLDGGAAGMEWEDIDLRLVCENAIDSLSSTAEENGIDFTLVGESVHISGIPQIIYSIIYNLCDNAIKYNHRGGQVAVRLTDLGSNAELSVSDTGIGISDADQERIFERFYRVDKSRSKEVGGTGLGLSIVKHGAMIHHAVISVESAPFKGSTFTVTLPKDQH